MSSSDHRIVLVLGTHRTGTKTLAAFFDTLPGAVGVHQDNQARWVNVASNMRLARRLSDAAFRRVTDRYFLRRLERQDTGVYVEANGFNYLAAQLAIERWPNTKIIHIVRDPRDFVSSWLNWTTTRFKSRLAHTLIPFWNLNGAQCGAVSHEDWNHWDPFTRACWYWTFKNQFLAETYGGNTTAYHFCRLEDLVDPSNRRSHIEQLVRFAGVDYLDNCERFFDKAHNMSQRSTLRAWDSWTSEQCATLARLCEPLMSHYGYGAEPEWLGRIGGAAGKTSS